MEDAIISSLGCEAALSVVSYMVDFYSRKGLDGLAATQIWSCTYDQFKRQFKIVASYFFLFFPFRCRATCQLIACLVIR
jgi:hypothetical protein